MNPIFAASLALLGAAGAQECGPECCPQENLFDQDEVTTLKVLTVGWKAPHMEQFWGPAFEEFKQGKVRIDASASDDIAGFQDLFEEIENDAKLGLELFDVYLTPPTILGTAASYDGFHDMTGYIEKNYLNEWLDIFPGYREVISTYEKKILMMPLDGDLLHLYYNKEVLNYYELNAPRTWDEYNEVAEIVNGQVFPLTNKTLIGSCFGRLPSCAGPYWAQNILATFTQTKGPGEGSLLDSKNMNHLTGKAFIETLKVMEKQLKFGLGRDEFSDCIGLQRTYIDSEECALTVNWGNSFLQDLARGKLGITRTPGSPVVLDRDSGNLVKCDVERCPYATYYDDIGFVNHAPYAAFGGWSGAVSNNIVENKKELATEFLAFSASKSESRKLVIPKVGSDEATVGSDPYRKSHVNVADYVDQGYDEETAKSYLFMVNEGLISNNLVIDLRIPEATKIQGELDAKIISHLNSTLDEEDEAVIQASRIATLKALDSSWTTIIDDYENQGDTTVPLLEIYQRLRGVFKSQNQLLNQIGSIRILGWALGSLVIVLAIAFGVWVRAKRANRVIKASQPIFLYFILAGVIILASAIFPLGIDDGLVGPNGCNAACLSVPWLVSIGFTFVFSALFSKMWRINRVFSAATSMRRVVITERDVLKPFATLMVLNVVILLMWSIIDPLKWKRVETSELESYGTCASAGQAWKAFLPLLIIVDLAALILANIQAYRGRAINDELSESKYIGLATLSMMQIFVIGVPLLVIVHTNPAAKFFVWTGIVFIVSSTTLLLIFVPKLINSRKPARKKSNVSSAYVSTASHATDSGSRAYGGSVKEIKDRINRASTSSETSATSGLDEITGDKVRALAELVKKTYDIDISPEILSLQMGKCLAADTAEPVEKALLTIEEDAGDINGEALDSEEPTEVEDKV